MNLMRKLAWAAMVATSGAPPSAVTSPPAPPAPAAPAAAPVAQPPQPGAERPPSRWFASDDEDLGDDDFEGEGWGFWGL